MKKGFKAYFICWLILLVLFNALCFLTPNTTPLGDGMVLNKFGGAFWAGYVCIMAAFVGNLICTKYAFQAENAEKFFLKVPLIRLSYAALIVTMIFGVAAMVIIDLPNWLGGAVCLLILGLYAIAVVKANAAGEVVEKREAAIAAKTLYIKSLTADADALQRQAKSDSAKELCRKVYEAVRYSDPMSHEALANEESAITLKFSDFAQAVASDDVDVGSIGKELLVLLEERNKKCKLLK